MSDRSLVVRTSVNPRMKEEILAYERAELAKVNAELRFVQCTTPDEVIAAAQDADVIIHPSLVPISRRVIAGLLQCRAIVLSAVGTNQVDVGAASERGIIVANLPDGWTSEVADQTMGLLLALCRRIGVQNRRLKAGDWWDTFFMMSDVRRLHEQTLGIVGFGRIGRAVTTRAQAFGLTVLAYDPLLEDGVFAAYGVHSVPFEDLLRRSDIISLHTPLTDRTKHMINEAALRLMQPHAVLINTARGAVVDEAALIRALREGWIAGAGLDVFEHEPLDPASPLLSMDNVVLTPHTAGQSRAVADEHRTKPVGEAVRILQGLPPRPQAFVNPEVWTRFTVVE